MWGYTFNAMLKSCTKNMSIVSRYTLVEKAHLMQCSDGNCELKGLHLGISQG